MHSLCAALVVTVLDYSTNQGNTMSMRTVTGLLLLVICLRGMNMQESTTVGTDSSTTENASGSSTTESSSELTVSMCHFDYHSKHLAMQTNSDTTVSLTTRVPAQTTSATGGSIRPLIHKTSWILFPVIGALLF
ncbi:hypothetical protein D915_007726 [Fasciola hepatica]|uniref:Uncharacterized protein n=1 Tax=Fasciola hepatica TaxID=6192 RepID=A0A4E0R738_FASHE|nr:hypothetical protein D915_007726 [Fasciola hepatica]